MNAKTWAPLAVALVLGLAAAVIARKSLMHSHSGAPAAKGVSVVVAAAALPPGHELAAEDLKLAPLTGRDVPPGMSVRAGELVGRVTVAPLVPGEPVLQTLLAPTGTSAGLAALVPAGFRAITLDFNQSSGVAGLLVPGCRVDVVTTALSQKSPDKSASRLIAQDVPVLAVGQRLSGSKPDGEKDDAMSRTVTLLVSPHDAEALDLASAATRCRLVLRGSGDNSEWDDDAVTLADLTGSGATVMNSVPVLPAVMPQQPAPTTQPTTQPAPPSVFDVPPRRVITLILGNDEKRIIFKEDKPDPLTRDPFSSTQEEP